jgi:hypothetical protein
MTDDDVCKLLRSDNSIVVIEAPAGCGKTYQAASYARDTAANLVTGKILVLTHTHAACSVIAERTKDLSGKLDIQTLDSLINQISTAYHVLLELPKDVSFWARSNKNGYEELAKKVAQLLRVNPMLSAHLASAYPVIICDEHQDSNQAQDEIVQLISEKGSLLRIFGDPLQIIPGGVGHQNIAEEAQARWEKIKALSVFGHLQIPHRWAKTNKALGQWVLECRDLLKNNTAININMGLPNGVSVIYAENISKSAQSYILGPENWSSIREKTQGDAPSLFIAGASKTVLGLRGSLKPQLPIWEGHTRAYLEKFIGDISDKNLSLDHKVSLFVNFLSNTIKGFSPSGYSNRLIKEVKTPTKNSNKDDLPSKLKVMAELIRESPNHVGFGLSAKYLENLIYSKDKSFRDVRIDYPRELSDLIKVGQFDDPLIGFAEISQRRSRAFPKPPRKALSTIHKSKGLESENVIIFACDESHFPSDKLAKRNLLYVAMSRATSNLTIVLSRSNGTLFFR